MKIRIVKTASGAKAVQVVRYENNKRLIVQHVGSARMRIKTDNGYLICSYSSVRYRKDLYEMNKLVEKAKQVVEKPFRSKKAKFY